MPAVKRRATSPVRPPATKKRATPNETSTDAAKPIADGSSKANGDAPIEERLGIIQRQFYPPEMPNSRCERYNKNELPRPLARLNAILKDTAEDRDRIQVGECVVHWFKRDLRLFDNKSLSLASKKARDEGVPLICIFLVSPQDYEAHCTSAARVDFDLRTLRGLQVDLEELDIPLYSATVEDRTSVVSHILERCKEWGARHVFCNIEYEVDELRRETELVKQCLAQNISLTAVHDDVVVPPGTLTTGTGKQYSVYSPWFKAWVKHIHAHPHLLDAFDHPKKNSSIARERFGNLFNQSPLTTPPSKCLDAESQKRLANYWPAGEHEAQERLERFLKDKISKYKDLRNQPSANAVSGLSVHFSAGTLAARTAIRAARDANSSRSLDAGNTGITTWVSELAWRDFYKHVMAHWPYVCMGKSFKYEYSNINWSYDEEHFRRWCEGKTGFPIVDAAMRQIKSMAYCHNRCRMIVASFLAKDLLLDWRMGERYFMENLIDGDFASNNGGWGFSASVGVDPQPYFRIFNPLLQSEKFDPEGEYIRKWVPELAGISGKAVHDPYGRGETDTAAKAGYPRPIVDHKAARQKALAVYKEGLGRSTANVGGGVHN